MIQAGQRRCHETIEKKAVESRQPFYFLDASGFYAPGSALALDLVALIGNDCTPDADP